MAPRLILRVASVFAATSGVLGAQLPLDARIAAGECWDASIGDGATYFPTAFQAHSESDVADLFEIVYAATFKVIISKMSKEQYVLTQCGQMQPTAAEVNAVAPLEGGYARKHFDVPLQSATAMSTVQLSFLEALGVEDRIQYVGQYSVAPCWQKALTCGGQLDSSNVTHLSSVDAVFMDCGMDCGNVHGQANRVHVPTTQEGGALATAEYIKYLGAFFNKEPEANDLFAAAKVAYRQASSGSSGTPPVVVWMSYSNYGGPSYDRKEFVVSQAAYKLALVEDAGGSNFDAAAALAGVKGLIVADASASNPAAGKTYSIPLSAFGDSKADAAAALQAALADVDVVIDENYAWKPSAYTFASFLSEHSLDASSALKFVRNKMVLRIDRTVSSSDGLDWYESRIARPDWALEGLAHELHEDASKRSKYFRNIAKGDTVDQVLTASMCSKTLPVCAAGAEPETIELSGPAGTEEETTSGCGSPSSPLGRAAVALAASATSAVFAAAAAAA